MPKPISVTVADGRCPVCKFTEGVTVQANKKGHLYIYCKHPGDGGCLVSVMSRSDAADDHLARTCVIKWRSPEYRAAYLGTAADPVEPPPDKKPAPPPAPKPAPKKKRSFLGVELVNDEEED